MQFSDAINVVRKTSASSPAAAPTLVFDDVDSKKHISEAAEQVPRAAKPAEKRSLSPSSSLHVSTEMPAAVSTSPTFRKGVTGECVAVNSCVCTESLQHDCPLGLMEANAVGKY